MTNPTTHRQVPAIQRYKIGYHSDEWGVRSLSPSGIYDDAGPWVRYEDHAAVITALRAYCQELEAQVILDCMTHVQNPAEIEHVAGDVSKNGAESNMSTQQTAAEATEEVENLRKALVYVAFALHDAPQYMLAQGIALIDGDTVRVSRDGWTVEASVNPHRQPAPATQQAASSAVLKAIREANMQLVRTGDDEFMLVTYKSAKAQCDGGQCGIGGYCDDCPTPQADSQPAPVRCPACSYQHGHAIGCENNPVDISLAAQAPVAARAPADSVTAPACELLKEILAAACCEDSETYLTSDQYRKLYDLQRRIESMPTPPAQAADSVLEDAARYRHLRDCNSGSLVVMQITGMGEHDWHVLTEDDADAAIDAARKQGGA